MRVAVTGASGLIGRPLVAALAADDSVDAVIAIDVRPTARRLPNVREVRRDVRDPEIAADLAGAEALVDLALRDHDIRTTVEANVAGSRNVFEAAIAAGAGTIVYASSSAVYGSAPDNPVPLREDYPLRPAPFAYPRTKFVIEDFLADLAARHVDVRIVRLRPSWVIGPGARLLLGRWAYVSLSDFDPLIQVTWIDDAVAAFTAALHANAARGPFNISAPGTVLSSEIAGLLGVRAIRLPYRARRAAAVAASWLRVPGALEPQFVDMDRYPIVMDTSRAASQLGWQARHDARGTFCRLRETL